MWAIFVALLVVAHVLPERFLALFAHEGHLCCSTQFVVLCFGVAFGTVEPLLAAWCTDCDLRVEYMFAETQRIGQVVCKTDNHLLLQHPYHVYYPAQTGAVLRLLNCTDAGVEC